MFKFKPKRSKSTLSESALTNMNPHTVLPSGGRTINTILKEDNLLAIFELLSKDFSSLISAAKVCRQWRDIIFRYFVENRIVTIAKKKGVQQQQDQHNSTSALHRCYKQFYKGLVPDQLIKEHGFDYFNFLDAADCFRYLQHDRMLQLRIIKCRLHRRSLQFEDTFFDKMKSLTKLVLLSIDLTDTDLGYIASSLPSLEVLTIDNITSEGFHGHNLVMLSNNLRSLTLNRCRDLVSTTLTHALREFCLRGMKIQVLNLEGQCIADMDKCLTYTIIKRMDSLKVWHFHVNLWSRINLPERFAALNIEKMVLIQSHFDSSLVSDECFRVLFHEPLLKLSYLQLKGEGTRLSDEAFLLLLESCPNLETLELSRLIRLSPRALLGIGHELGARKLRRLGFTFMRLLPQMLENIVQHSPHLEELFCEHVYFEKEHVNDVLIRLIQIYRREQHRPRLSVQFNVPFLRIDTHLIEQAPANLHIKVDFLHAHEIPDFRRAAFDHYPKSDRQIQKEFEKARDMLEKKASKDFCSMQ